jgi:hypothetical protein
MVADERAGFEAYLRSRMQRLCSGGMPLIESPFDHLLELTAKMKDTLAVIGTPRISSPLAQNDLPSSLLHSVEHRFSLDSWPLYDFIVCESPVGYAWGHRFARKPGEAVPPIRTIADLSQWSHTVSEINDAVGTAADAEGWAEWTTGTYGIGDSRVRLCFVFDLLQSVTVQV